MSYLKDTVEAHVERYFEDDDAVDIYDRVMSHVWPGLLCAVLDATEGNKTLAAKLLGVNRGTLRKQLEIYGVKSYAKTLYEPVSASIPPTQIKTEVCSVEFSTATN